MKIYLAAAWSRQQEIREFAPELEAQGHEITSRWLYEKPAPVGQDRERHLRETAFIDIEDVRRADILVRFTDEITQLGYDSNTPIARVGLVSGARMFEFGLAWSEGIPVVVVGGIQNVFDRLPNVVHLPDKEALLKFMSTKEI